MNDKVGRIIIVVGDATETVDTFYPFLRVQEEDFLPVVAGPEQRRATRLEPTHRPRITHLAAVGYRLLVRADRDAQRLTCFRRDAVCHIRKVRVDGAIVRISRRRNSRSFSLPIISRRAPTRRSRKTCERSSGLS